MIQRPSPVKRTLAAGRLANRILVRLATVLAFTGPAAAGAEGLSPEERRVAGFADGRRDEVIGLLERVVNIDSATQNLGGVKRVGEVFRAELAGLGFETRWEGMPARMHRAGHLIAERGGTTGKRVLLIGHLDTVLEGRRFERAGPRATGAGALDMKGGDVILVYALKALHSLGALEGRRVIVVLTGDEEDAGLPIDVSRRALMEAAGRSDVALAFENAVDDTATVARRGASTWRLDVSGKTGHSSGIFRDDQGSGAIFEAARILDEFRRRVPEKYLTINPSVMAGGTTADYDGASKSGKAEGKLNVVPARVVVEGDLRFISEAQKAAARDRMREIVGRSLPKTEASLQFADEYPAMAPTPGNDRLLAAYDGASRDLGLGGVKALDPGRRGAGDVSFVASRLDALDGLGARGKGSHTPDEWVDLDSLTDQIKRAALLIYRLTR